MIIGLVLGSVFAAMLARRRADGRLLAGGALCAALLGGPAGFLLSQRAFQMGRLLAPVNSVISTVDPVAAAAIGIVVLGERMVVTPPAVLVEALAVATTVLGVVVVSRRAARIIETERTTPADGREAISWG